MRNRPTMLLLFCLAAFLGCEGDQPAMPDLEAISRDYCTIVQMCNPDAAFSTQDACEMHSANEYSEAKSGDQECFDARMAWESCVGALRDCEEYDVYLHAMGTKCLKERDEFNNYCMVI